MVIKIDRRTKKIEINLKNVKISKSIEKKDEINTACLDHMGNFMEIFRNFLSSIHKVRIAKKMKILFIIYICHLVSPIPMDSSIMNPTNIHIGQ